MLKILTVFSIDAKTCVLLLYIVWCFASLWNTTTGLFAHLISTIVQPRNNRNPNVAKVQIFRSSHSHSGKPHKKRNKVNLEASFSTNGDSCDFSQRTLEFSTRQYGWPMLHRTLVTCNGQRGRCANLLGHFESILFLPILLKLPNLINLSKRLQIQGTQ